ncbi:MAG: type I DNA topoisomerase [Firmicutes bacterium]|nr:type I DNA topoisomerase [Bacillota bacterium]
MAVSRSSKPAGKSAVSTVKKTTKTSGTKSSTTKKTKKDEEETSSETKEVKKTVRKPAVKKTTVKKTVTDTESVSEDNQTVEPAKKTVRKAAPKTAASKTAKTTKKVTAAKTTKTTAKKSTTSKTVKNAASGKGLIIVESPAKARTLEKYSKGKYRVMASMGHVRDLPKSKLGIDVEKAYTPSYITIRGKKETIEALRKAAQASSKIFLASDPDREGEAIAWHLAQLLKVENPMRIELHEITQNAFEDAVSNPRVINDNLVNAQQARRVLDRLVGYNLSPLLWRKITGGLSAGRVQSVALKLICDRQRDIDAFVPEEYWTLGVLASKLQHSEKDAFEANLLKKKSKKVEISDKKGADEIISELKKSKFIVKSVQKKDKKQNPYPPFRTSTLQQEAHRKLGFKAQKTMAIAQELYEGVDIGAEGRVGLITYMRTDSARVSEGARAEADRFITENYGKEYSGGGRQFAVKGRTQDAHEAIRPTSLYRTPDHLRQYLKRDTYRLYELIWNKFLASQMAPCVLEITTVDIEAGEYLFRANDSRVKFPGFTKVYGTVVDVEAENNNSDEEEKSGAKNKRRLPDLVEGEEVKVHKYLPLQHFTQPPPAFTEATLIKMLEEKGIGRPSTYAPIVDTIQKRGYVAILEKKLRPTDLGYKVNDLLAEFFPDILNVDFTAGMENKLDMVEEGKEDWVQVIDKFFVPFNVTLKDADQKIPKVEMEPEMTDQVCEKCGKPMVIKRGRFGKFMACSGFPDCKNAKPIVVDTGVPCPEDGCGGTLIEKGSRKGKFYGCSNYPNCKFATWYKPLNEKCSVCGKMVTLKFTKQGRPYKACIDNKCAKMKMENAKLQKEQEKNQE